MSSTPLVPSPPAQAPSRARWKAWLIPPAIALVVLLGYWAYSAFSRGDGNSGLSASAKFYPVTPIELQVKVSKDGELQAVNNIDVLCLVEGGSTIVQIVKEGAFVKKGDVLVLLDSSLIRQKIEDNSLDIQKATNDLTAAKELLQIQEIQNSANLDAAKVDLELARIALQQYVEGTYPQLLADAQTKFEMAKIMVTNKQDELRQVKELYGKSFVTLTDVKSGELSLTTVTNDLKSAETALTVLTKYTHEMEMAGKKNYVAQAEQKLARVQKENASNLSKGRADVDAKQQALVILKRRADRVNEQMENCTIKAPADGMVVYAANANTGNNQPIQEGTQVRERQPLLRLPDTTSMKAVVKVNESQVTRLAPGQRSTVWITGVPGALGATLTKISPVADGGQRWWNPDLREYPVELTLDNTPTSLKPGIGIKAEIMIDSLPDSLAVPLTSLYSEGAEHFVFVRQTGGAGIAPHRVKIGQSNETHARLTDGVQAGDNVLMLQPGQGRELLEKAGIQAAPPEQAKPKGGKKRAAPAKPDAPKEAKDASAPREVQAPQPSANGKEIARSGVTD